MNATVNSALQLWGLEGADWSLIAARENRVFKVNTRGGQSYALRLHRRAFRSDAELTSELEWMDALAKGGLNVPAPIAAMDGACLHRVDDVQIDVLSWLPGAPLGETGQPLSLTDRQGVFRRIGVQMARLHEISDAWTPPENFDRWSWDRAGLLGNQPVWGRFWENPTLSHEDKTLFEATRDRAEQQLAEVEKALDYGLIHADLVRENLMIDGDRVYLIDFDDGGWGFRLFDLATFLFKNRSEPDFQELNSAFLDGYQSRRSINIDALPLFMLLRAFTYVGWVINRMEEPGATGRSKRFVETARTLATEARAA
ncbi:homoserine kinase [Alphaproteobacteria bacterium]|nr:homoserine kinase [Alphaproteobacteria bacterium]